MTDKLEVWGFVDSGRWVKNAEGVLYRIDNQHGWVLLVPKTGGEHITFESMDKIDHERFTILD